MRRGITSATKSSVVLVALTLAVLVAQANAQTPPACPEGQLFSPLDKICVPCPQGLGLCKSCQVDKTTGKPVCTGCKDTATQDKNTGVCVLDPSKVTCPDGQFFSPLDAKCVACNSKMQFCTACSVVDKVLTCS